LGTTTAIGGPPLALIMRSMSPERVRGTLSVCFVIGSAISIALLTGAGALGSMHLRAALLYAPAVIAGFFLSSVVNGHLNRRLIFLGSVTISLIGSVMVITQAAGIF